jgi:hypothetical protein
MAETPPVNLITALDRLRHAELMRRLREADEQLQRQPPRQRTTEPEPATEMAGWIAADCL